MPHSFHQLIQFITSSLPKEGEPFNQNFVTHPDFNDYAKELHAITLTGEQDNLWEQLRTLLLNNRVVGLSTDNGPGQAGLNKLAADVNALSTGKAAVGSGQDLAKEETNLKKLRDLLQNFEDSLNAPYGVLDTNDKTNMDANDPILKQSNANDASAGTGAPTAEEADVYVIKLEEFMAGGANDQQKGEAWVKEVELVTRDGFKKGKCEGVAVRIKDTVVLNDDQKRALAEEMVRFYIQGGGNEKNVPLQGKDETLVMYAMQCCMKMGYAFELRGHDKNDLENKLVAIEKKADSTITVVADLTKKYSGDKSTKGGPFPDPHAGPGLANAAESRAAKVIQEKIQKEEFTTKPDQSKVDELKSWFEKKAFERKEEGGAEKAEPDAGSSSKNNKGPGNN